MTDFLCPTCGPINEDDGLLMGPGDAVCCAFCGRPEEDMTPLRDAYEALVRQQSAPASAIATVLGRTPDQYHKLFSRLYDEAMLSTCHHVFHLTRDEVIALLKAQFAFAAAPVKQEVSMSNDMREAFEKEYNRIKGTSLSVLKNLRADYGYYDQDQRINDAYKLWLASGEWHSQQAQGAGPSLYRCSKCGAEAWTNDTGPELTCNMGCGLSPAYRVQPAPAAVPSETILKAVEKKIRAADRTHHPIVRSTLIMEALEILDGYAAPAPAERGGQAGGEHE